MLELAGLALMPIGFIVAALGLEGIGAILFAIGYGVNLLEIMIAKDREEAPRVERRPSPSELKGRPNKKPGE